MLKKPGGSMTLLPHQALALFYLRKYGRLFGGKLGVGSGKTLITMLAARMTGARRPLLLAPADLLRDKTPADIYALSQHWEFIPPRVMSYEKLSMKTADADLRAYRPDLVIADEAHELKNIDAGRAKKLIRFLGEFPTTFCPLSGTICGKKVKHFAHLSLLSLGEWSPFPGPMDGPDWAAELLSWGEALDGDTPCNRPPGAILSVAPWHSSQPGADETAAARSAFAERLRTIPGVVESGEMDVPTSINIIGREVDPPADMLPHWAELRSKWKLPDGRELVDAKEIWAAAMQLSFGFFYRWKTPGPKPWMDARKAWSARMRAALTACHWLDTPAQIQDMADVQKWEEWLTWKQIAPSFDPETEPVWVSDFFFDRLQQWGNKGEGVIWIPHRAVAERIPAMLKIPYYGEGGLDATGNSIANASGLIAASDVACVTGYNLQHAFSRCLVTAPRASAEWWEQMIGRFHRPGQKADVVRIDVAISCLEMHTALRKLEWGDRYVQDMTRARTKWEIATKSIPHSTKKSPPFFSSTKREK